MQINVIEPHSRSKRKVRVAAYCRVSTDADEQENSLTNQRDYYETVISENPDYEFVNVYYDFGISGFKERRPGFQEMMEDARKGKIDLILTKSISRMSRNTSVLLKAVRELKSMGIGIFFELQNLNSLSCEGELMMTIYAAFAQAESDDCSKNAYLTYSRHFRDGIPAVRVGDCYGFRYGTDGAIEVDRKDALVIKKIFKLASEKIPPARIAAHLNKNGYLKRSGALWDTVGIFRILRNEIYKGDIMMQKTYLDEYRIRHRNLGQRDRFYVPDNHPAIVSPELWNEVQEILDEKSFRLKTPKEGRRMGGNSHNTYPLTRKLFCPKCGAVLHHRVSNRGRQIYWSCSTNIKKGPDCCSGINVPEEVVMKWEISEPSTVIMTEDEFGRQRYSTMPKDEYEAKRSCPYKPKPPKASDSHNTYPLSGRLYCSKCGTVMHHQTGWNKKGFWWCGKRVKQGAAACEGVRVPEAVADTWKFDGEVYVTEGVGDDGKISYSYQSKQ